jgi:hypothetical protein
MRTSNRSQRNNPYLVEDLAVTFHHSAAGVLWRWRTEITLLIIILAWYWPAHLLPLTWWAPVLQAAAIGTVMAVPVTRRFIIGRCWCLLSRHRLQRVCYETRMHTRAGRLPHIVWIRPSKVGERAWILCRAGICADDFDAYKAEIAAACYAREARITRNRKWSQLVTVDIVRHDPLTAAHTIESLIHRRIQAPPPGRTEAA